MAFELSIVGATGAVGRTMVEVLEKSGLPISKLNLYASGSSRGKILLFRGVDISVKDLSSEILGDAVLLAVDPAISKNIRKKYKSSGKYFIDNSSAFRMDDDTPLVIPSINGDSIPSKPGFISNPNCSTIEMLLALFPIRQKYGLKKIIVTTLQSVSGSGNAAVDALSNETLAYLQKGELDAKFYDVPISFNVIPQIGDLLADGSCSEEEKMYKETVKIFRNNDIQVLATTLRVPTFFSHFESITLSCSKPPKIPEVRSLIMNDPYLKLMESPSGNIYPTPLSSTGTDLVEVGRLRISQFDPHELSMVISADNLRIGAATNAVRILAKISQEGYL